MKMIKLMIIAELLTIYTVALSENGFVKLIGLTVLVFLGMIIAAKLEKRYGNN